MSGPPTRSTDEPRVSVVVVAWDMARELPRTITSLLPPTQRGIRPEQLEVIVVDNGSPTPVELAPHHRGVRLLRLETDSVSPAAAVNAGIRASTADLIGVMIDGARMASPGLLRGAIAAAAMHRRSVVSTVAFHLGPDVQTTSVANGYDAATEDALLASVPWAQDGYRLFDIAAFAESSRTGWFRAPTETNALFLPQALWHELGGADERFVQPGGGLCNLDLFARACALPDTQLVQLLGEATFHQVHGGVATNRPPGTSPWTAFHEEYVSIRGHAYRQSTRQPLLLGHLDAVHGASVAASAAALTPDDAIS